MKKQKDTFLEFLGFCALFTVIMVFNSFSSSGGLGTLAAILVAPFFCIPHVLLYYLTALTKRKLFVLNIILILAGLMTNFIVLKEFNFNINLCMIINIVAHILFLIYAVIKRK